MVKRHVACVPAFGVVVCFSGETRVRIRTFRLQRCGREPASNTARSSGCDHLPQIGRVASGRSGLRCPDQGAIRTR